MKSSTKKLLLIGGIFCGIGLLIMGIVFLSIQCSFSRLNTEELVEHREDYTVSITDISVTSDSGSIKLLPSEDKATHVVCRELVSTSYEIDVKNGKLMVSEKADTRPWYEKISFRFDFNERFVTIYLPEGTYATLQAEAESGSIIVADAFSFRHVNLRAHSGSIVCEAAAADTLTITSSSGSIACKTDTAERLTLQANSGSVKLTDASIGNLQVTVSSGSLQMEGLRTADTAIRMESGILRITDMISSGDVSIRSGSGSIHLTDCDAASYDVHANSGNVHMQLLSDMLYDARTGSGFMSLPPTNPDGGLCRITTSSGSIYVTVKK